jgi:hypothetical protein
VIAHWLASQICQGHRPCCSVLWTLTDGSILSDRWPVAWVDTCVMLDLYSAKDLLVAKRTGDAADVERRRVRARSALWMATVFSYGKALTLGYRHEFDRNLQKHMDSDPELAKWTFVLGHLFHKYGVLDGWVGGVTSAAAERKNRDRDQFMRDECLKIGMVYITEDGESLDLAKAMGVNAKRPDEYAEELLPLEVAHSLFKDRLVVAAARFVTDTPEPLKAQRTRDMLGVRALYEAIWSSKPGTIPAR